MNISNLLLSIAIVFVAFEAMFISIKLTKLQVAIRSMLMAGIAVAKSVNEETPEEVKDIHINYALHSLVTACYHVGLVDKKDYKEYCETFNPMTPH